MDRVKLSSVLALEEMDPYERKVLTRRISKLILPVVLIAWLVFLSLTSPEFLTSQNMFNVTRQVAVVGILALGQLLCLIAGHIDLSNGAFLGLFGAILAGLSLEIGLGPALATGLIMALMWGLMNGYLISLGRGISVIVTLATMYVARGLTLIYTDGHPITNFPRPYGFLGTGNLGPIPWNFISFASVAVAIGLILRYFPIGRHLFAVGGNQDAARVCGISVRRVTIGVFISSAVLSAFGAVVLLGRVASAQPNAGLGMELDSIAAVLIGGASVSGGAGSVSGTIVGVFMLGFINNGLNLMGVSGFYQNVIKGLIILLAVVVDTLQRRTR